MKPTSAWILLLLTSLTLSIYGCGGGNSSSGGGGNPPPSTTEILYASDFGNDIYAFRINQSTGALTQTASFIPIGGETVGDTDMAVTPSGSFLYAANDANSEINCYAINSSGTLTLTADSPFPVEQPTPGSSGLTVDPTGRFFYTSTTADFGAVAGFTIDAATGALTVISGGPFSSPGHGGPPLEIAVDPTGRFLFASAQFDDVTLPAGYNVWGFTIDGTTGALTSMPGSPFATQGNSQPDGIKADPSGKFLYVALSNAGSIAAFTIDGTTGALTAIPGSPFATAPTPFTQTYELTISPSGKFLYAFNFNGNTIGAFTIDSTTGVLTTVAGSPFTVSPEAEGGLIVDPSGQFLYLTIGYGTPDAFDIFDIDQSSGVLTPNANSPVAGNQVPLGLAVAKFQ